jgi:uncharacterized protein YcaQ
MLIEELRHRAIACSLLPPTTLRRVVERLGFVQADPIQAPARAQDLILRPRVKGYRVGDLERHYTRLGLEEDFLYAYGFMPRATWRLLHPRDLGKLTAREQRVLDFALGAERVHPRDLDEVFGRKRVTNDWGGMSQETTRILEKLHHRGALRICARDNGIRIYTAAAAHEPLEPAERVRGIALLIASILAPVTERMLRAAISYTCRWMAGREAPRSTIAALVRSGELESETVDGVRFYWPAGARVGEPNGGVRFLAPFDPLVWDRRRFTHFWGWTYRFEAYTPVAKRKLGYYALPMLWRDQMIGWVNAGRDGSVEAGFQGARPRDAAFQREFDDEVSRLRDFLRLSAP